MNDIIAIDKTKCTLTATSAQLNGNVDFKEWQRIGRTFAKVEAAYLWWIGDWLLFGVRNFGDKSRLALEYAHEIGLQPETLRQAIRVSESCQVGSRLPSLSWSHHQEVAPLPNKEQKTWLAKAEQNHWSVSDLRIAIRRGKGEYATELAHVDFNPVSNWLEEDRWFKRWEQQQPIYKWPIEQRKKLVEEMESKVIPWYNKLKATL
jgi:hypothetical protein